MSSVAALDDGKKTLRRCRSSNRILVLKLMIVFGLGAAGVGCGGDSAEQHLEKAKQALSQHHLRAAVIELKSALQQQPGLGEARFLLGKALLDGGDAAGAKIELQKAEQAGYSHDQIAPLQAQIMLMTQQFDKLLEQFGSVKLSDSQAQINLLVILSRAYSALGHANEARQTLDAALKLDPGNVAARLLDAQMKLQSGNVADGLAILSDLTNKAPSDPRAWLAKAQYFGSNPQWSGEAKSAYQTVLKLDEKSVQAYSGLMSVLISTGDLKGAQEELALMQASLPHHSQTHFYAAYLALSRGDLKSAQESVQAMLRSVPNDPRYLLLAGVVEARAGSFEQAEKHLRQASELAPQNPSPRLALAQIHLRIGEPQKVASDLQVLLKTSPPNQAALSLAGDASLRMGDTKAASKYFHGLLELDPNNVKGKTALAISGIGAAGDGEALNELHRLAASDSNAGPDMALVYALIQRGDLDKAMDAVAGLEKKQAKNPGVDLLRGEIELARGHRPAAIADFEAALKLNAVFEPAIDELVALDVEDRKFDQAIKCYAPLIAKDPKNLKYQLRLLALKAAAGEPAEEQSRALQKMIEGAPLELDPRLALIRLAVQQHDNKKALALALEAQRVLPDKPELFDTLSRLQVLNGDLDGAQASLRKWSTVQADSPVPFYRLAELQARLKNDAGAIENLKKCLAIKPDFLPAQTALMSLDLAQGDVAAAKAISTQVQGQQPVEVGQQIQAEFEMNQKNYVGAADDYKKALAARPSTDVAIKLDVALLMAGKTSEAKAARLEWLRTHPNDSTYLFHVGEMQIARNELVSAEQTFVQLRKLQPDSPNVMNNLAWVLNKEKKPGAGDLIEMALKLKPGSPAFLDTLIEIQRDEGHVSKALETARHLVAVAPDAPAYRLRLAELLIADGRKTEAAPLLQQLAALGGQFPNQDEVKRLLAQ